MALTVFTGGVRSGKSAAAAAYAEATGLPVTVAVAGVGDGDEEMRRRIEAHRRSRPPGWRVLEVAGVPPVSWLRQVGDDECLLVDCVGTMLAGIAWPASGAGRSEADAEGAVHAARGLAEALIARKGETVVVTNEVGWGVVPVSKSGRAFRDAMGVANRMLVDAADRAYLVVCGRLVDLSALPCVQGPDRSGHERRGDGSA
ncbi:MAG: bifunctional adenosylcobinamide kinase/adenosylcobinamide-phosphate guanylyltransferase [Anaerosomatales bacterium]|nr:bifunctional adenosylcobinamide kinase/adenosylcobinamide-phosphate guanylyltransferase [Anaerosomatales bacterium]